MRTEGDQVRADERSHLQGAALVAGSGFVLSFGALAFRAVDHATDWQYLFYRGSSVAVAMAILLFVRYGHDSIERVRRAGWRQFAAGTVLGGLFTLFVMSLARTTVAMTLFMQAAAPFAAALLAWIFLRERVRRATWIAMSVAFVGIAGMVGGHPDTGSTFGIVLAAGIPLGLGAYSVLLRSVDEVEPAVPALVGGAVAGVVAGFVAMSGPGLAVSPHDFVMAIIGGGVLLGIGLPMFNAGHRTVAAAEVNLLLLVEVILGPVWVWMFVGETPSTTTLAGGAVVLAAVAGMTLAADRSRRAGAAVPTA